MKSKDKKHGLPSLSLVFGYIAVKELGRLEDKVAVLARLGYGNAEIAKICGTTPASVGTLKSRSRKKRGRISSE
jgi:DNA-binding CsgD family transcriptional regulator